MQTLITGGSLIQSTFGGEGHHNLEAVITRPASAGMFHLQHYWRDMSKPDKRWNAGATIPTDVTGPAAICQRRDHDGVRGNFEVAVPADGGMIHYFFDNSENGARSWIRRSWIRVAGFAAPGATGPGAIIENRTNSNLELVALHGHELVRRKGGGDRRKGGVAAYRNFRRFGLTTATGDSRYRCAVCHLFTANHRSRSEEL